MVDLDDEFKSWAAQELRSLNGQVEFLLRDSLHRRTGSKAQEPNSQSGSDPPP